jgi:hypothetical protein
LLATLDDGKDALRDVLSDIFQMIGTMSESLSELRELAYIAERSRDQVRNPPQTAKRERLRTHEADQAGQDREAV